MMQQNHTLANGKTETWGSTCEMWKIGQRFGGCTIAKLATELRIFSWQGWQGLTCNQLVIKNKRKEGRVGTGFSY